MGVRILADGETDEAVLYCSTSGWAFGPIFPSREAAELFLNVYDADPRSFTDAELAKRFAEFTHDYICECGTVCDENDDHSTFAAPGLRYECTYCIKKRTGLTATPPEDDEEEEDEGNPDQVHEDRQTFERNVRGNW